MKVKITNKDKDTFGKEFKVRRLNYDQILINYPNKKGLEIVLWDDIELITESSIDEFLKENRYFLKIRLNRGISVNLYKAILETINEVFNIEITEFDVLKDKYQVTRRGIWEKNILCIINRNPYEIIANGKNFRKKDFNINLKEILEEEFIQICNIEMDKIKKEIKRKEKILSLYEEAITIEKY